ncbi:hypothetical protein I6F35_33755 [Bradyrhizobium sp. BRP22]|uniref:hypothetical protein n=1 Tax=Bradyrhizobium sp. BRP22 TaxID=2793821 RepID=UPI001CD4AD28|nr:hypothetical protein [Bradyrhizobium sp. BRP22]MCA1458102.1 hypothetical protein [Bradyrhizobium sp. BRP22]
MLNIIEHGTWARYVPNVLPPEAPAGAMFCKRESDGQDWYEYVHGGAVFAPNAITATVDIDGRVQAVTREADRLFPQSCLLIEILGDNETGDVQAAYGGKLYDPVAGTLSTFTPPAVVPESCTKLGLKRAFEELGMWQQIKAAIAADPEAQEEWDLCIEVRRSDRIVQRMIAELQFATEQVDDLLIRANQLV